MNKLKKMLALTVAMLSAVSICSCGSSTGDGDSEAPVTTVEKVDVEDTEEIENIADDAQKEIIWMGTYDLNPNEKRGEDKSVE
ncbi:MAG TPA: ABC transporter substrate-binding protein, partial [Ruminococcus sp.]|nr:ABC transporter substrate-binding protein [Ruminococcus sp.]